MKIRSVYTSKRWARLRKRALDRAGWRCERCKSPGRLECHHVVSMWTDFTLAFDMENIEVLCRACHIDHHRLDKLGKETKPKNAPVQEPWLALVTEISDTITLSNP